MDFSTPSDADFNSPAAATSEEFVNRIQLLAEESLESNQPMEMEPTRGKLFAIFAEAFHGGLTASDGPLCADELTRLLGQRWGLDQSAQQSIAAQKKLSDADLAKMRVLWATLRLWMEWDYAWNQWDKFNTGETPNRPR